MNSNVLFYTNNILILQIYSDKTHAISGSVTSKHLYRTMTDFIRQECWDGAFPRVNGEDLHMKDE